ncbi:MAG TPA: hypothetical protein VHN14_06200 [Kofleriaceae bacterium]|nr:hypothetical protein [Kofleriaceae bacterium]
MTDLMAKIAALIAEGDDRAAFDHLRAGLGWPTGKAIPAGDLPRWLALLAELAIRRDAEPLAELASAAVHDPDSPDRLYDLGYALIDADAPAIAATVLWRCLALVGDSEEVVCELVSALESALAYSDAFAVLEGHAALRARSFLCRYLYAFNAAMTGRLEVTRAMLAQLAPDSEETTALEATIRGICERADRVVGACPLDARDLRGWHYVLTGGLVLHQSPYGFDEPMHGRYAWLADSLPRIATGLARLATLVEPLALPCIYAPPGRDHEIVAHAAGQRLGLPVAPWPAVGVPAPGLIVMYDLADLPGADLGRLIQRRPGQIVFAHASPWTPDSPLAPDVTTLLYQSIVPPWGAHAIVDPETHQVSESAPDDRSVQVIASELAATPGLDGSELSADEPARWAALVGRAWPPQPGPRSRLWAGGPVPSNRFGGAGMR